MLIAQFIHSSRASTVSINHITSHHTDPILIMLFSICYSQYSDYAIRHLRFCLFSLGWLACWLASLRRVAVGPRGGYTEAVHWHVGNYGWSCPPIRASHGNGKRREAQTAAFSGSLAWRNRFGYPGHQATSPWVYSHSSHHRLFQAKRLLQPLSRVYARCGWWGSLTPKCRQRGEPPVTVREVTDGRGWARARSPVLPSARRAVERVADLITRRLITRCASPQSQTPAPVSRHSAARCCLPNLLFPQ